MAGNLDEHFVLDIFQTGSGTSTNTNANEVIAHRASEILGGAGNAQSVHPNDQVNYGQSSNDVIPSAIHAAAVKGIRTDLLPALERLGAALEAKAEEFADIVKSGRTHLMDATPVTLGQEFGGYATQVRNGDQATREGPARTRGAGAGRNRGRDGHQRSRGLRLRGHLVDGGAIRFSLRRGT